MDPRILIDRYFTMMIVTSNTMKKFDRPTLDSLGRSEDRNFITKLEKLADNPPKDVQTACWDIILAPMILTPNQRKGIQKVVSDFNLTADQKKRILDVIYEQNSREVPFDELGEYLLENSLTNVFRVKKNPPSLTVTSKIALDDPSLLEIFRRFNFPVDQVICL
jgi:hypothetical protein